MKNMRILLIALIAYGVFHLGVFLAWVINLFTFDFMLDAVSDSYRESLYYYRNGNVFGKVLAVMRFASLTILFLPEVIVVGVYWLADTIIEFLKDFIMRKCYPNIVTQVIEGVPSSKVQLLRDAKIPFSIGKDYVVITGLANYEKAKELLREGEA